MIIQESDFEKNLERLVDPQEAGNDKALDLTLRPRFFDEYIGQGKAKESLEISIEAAKKRSDPLDHILLYGPPGLGKTTLAHVIANEMGSSIKITSGPALEKSGDLAAILTNLEEGSILFIDEIHRLNRTIEEILYPAMEDYALDLVIGKGPSAKTLRIDLPKFTIIGATTMASLLSAPLRDRFGIMHHLNFYEEADLEKIIRRSAGILKVDVYDQSALEIARRSRRTPRIANRLLKRVRDYCQVRSDGSLDLGACRQALAMMEVDELGLDWVDRKILSIIIDRFGGGPVGLNTISASTGEEMATIEEVYEPFLLQLGFIDRTPRGRVATAAAYSHLGKKKLE